MMMAVVSRSSLILSLWAVMIIVPVASAPLWDIMLPPYADVDTLALARAADWKETASAHVISMDVPGVRREDLRVEVEAQSREVRITGEARPEEPEGAAGRFWRQFPLPANADVDGIRAHLENGVVRITVPKLAEEKKEKAKVVPIEEEGSNVIAF